MKFENLSQPLIEVEYNEIFLGMVMVNEVHITMDGLNFL